MSSISFCPKCDRQITIPLGAESSALVRCPLCSAEYPLHEALSKAPPALILIGGLAPIPLDEVAVSSPQMSIWPADEETNEPVPTEAAPTAIETGMPWNDTPPGEELLSAELEEDAFEAATETEISLSDFEEPAASNNETLLMDDPLLGDALAEPIPSSEADALSESFPLESKPSLAGAAEEDELQFDAPGEIVAFDLDSLEEAPRESHEEGVDLGATLAFDQADSAAGEAIGFEPADEEDHFKLEQPIARDPMLGVGQPGPEPMTAIKAKPKKVRRKSSPVITVIGFVMSALVACPIAYAILLWGLNTDALGIAPALPAWMVPASMRPVARKPFIPPPMSHTADDAEDEQTPPTPDQSASVPGADDASPTGEFTPAEGGPVTAAGATEPVKSAPDAFADEETEDADPAPMPPAPKASAPEADLADDDLDAIPTEDTLPDELPGDAGKSDLDSELAGDAPMEAGSTDDSISELDSGLDEELSEAAPSQAPPDPIEDEVGDEGALAEDENAENPLMDAPADEAQAIDDLLDDGDLAADETAPPAAEPEASVGPRDRITYTADDLNKALDEVKTASAALAGADKASRTKLKGQYYKKLYQLAETTTFADKGANPAAARQLVETAAADPKTFTEIGKAAVQWLGKAKGKEHQGVLLAGSVQSVKKQGKVYETLVLLTDGTTVASVLSPEQPKIAAQDEVVVLGSIVEQPAAKIEGYQGQQPLAVWSGETLSVPN